MLMHAALLALQTTFAASPQPVAVPFGVGETFEYSARMGFLRGGSAWLRVEEVERVRGVPSWHFSFDTKVNVAGVYKSESRFDSWTGVSDFISRRFIKDMEEHGGRHVQDFRIHPDSGFFRRGADTGTKATSTRPLDDVALFYYVRTVPLQVGKTYTWNNYWRKAQNPVTVKVLKREEMKLPDGRKVQAFVLHPIVDEKNGMFSRKSNARLWVTDDFNRIPVQIQTTYDFGTVKLVLVDMKLATKG